MEDLKHRKRGRDESEVSEADTDSQEVKKLREKLLDCLDDDADFGAANQDLDSFMKSFEEEITASPSTVVGDASSAADLAPDSGESRPDLGYLLEASDDELGLPPTTSYKEEIGTELVRVESESSEFASEFWEMPSYDSFEFGFVETDNFDGGNGEYVALDGLFDHSDLGFGLGEFSRRPETLPAQ
ncbi:uncharacterized protein LOC127261420 [Andrographis paniculata]|uniref:uncharacterized protein LOC127261420 n=1 Tax=Andrographis paniculata TaxID=175694 RepID=UPI0021E6E9EC|nr:uncharacterized protein LOC127261420 [Andrographis paniculata]